MGANIASMSAVLRLLRLTALATFCILPVLHAETWILANGDRLTGILLAQDAQNLEIDHPQLGRLTVPRSALQPESAALAAAPTPAPAPAPAPAAAKPAAAAPSTPATAKPAVARVDDAKKDARPKWTRSLEVGFIMQEGVKSTRDLNLRAQAEGRIGRSSIRGTARVTRSESEGLVTRDRDEADFRWRRDFNKRTFAQALTTYSSDDIRKVDLSLEQQLGGGYRLIDSDRHKVNVGLGAVVQQFEREGYEDQTALLGSFFQDYTLAWNSRFKVTQEASIQVADRSPVLARSGTSSTTTLNAPREGAYRFKLNTALQSKVTDEISLNLRFEYDYDHSIAEENLRADSRLTTSLGYSW